MTLLKRELHKRTKSPTSNDQDWWWLVFDTDTKRLYVEHAWEYVDVREGSSEPHKGHAEFEFTAFLRDAHEGLAQQALIRLISSLFEDPQRA